MLIVSGLAKGVDTAAHTSAIEAGGVTAAVIGTPLDKAYPAENASLQALIYREYLLLSPFTPGEKVYKGNFPKRNRIMAAITDATVIIEASDRLPALSIRRRSVNGSADGSSSSDRSLRTPQ